MNTETTPTEFQPLPLRHASTIAASLQFKPFAFSPATSGTYFLAVSAGGLNSTTKTGDYRLTVNEYTLGIDTSTIPNITYDQAKAINGANEEGANYQFVGEYLGDHNNALNLATSVNLTFAGLPIVSIYQHPVSHGWEPSESDRSKANRDFYILFFSTDSDPQADSRSIAYNHGLTDAETAFNAASALHQPHGTAIYFATDIDPGGGSTGKSILMGMKEYFEGIATFFQSHSGYAVGVYGVGAALTEIIGDGLAQYSWLAVGYAQTGSANWLKTGGWDLYQYSQNIVDDATGIKIDQDFAASSNYHDFGGWFSPLQCKLVDGYIGGATVFADANGNGFLDIGEASTGTAADGSFTPIAGGGHSLQLVA